MREQLRDYQTAAVRKVQAALRREDAALFICPTGGGKTHVLSALVEWNHRKGGRALVLSDRTLLMEQIAATIERLTGLTVGIEQADRRVDDLPPVVCATIQSLSRPERLRRFKLGVIVGLVARSRRKRGIPPYRGGKGGNGAPAVP